MMRFLALIRAPFLTVFFLVHTFVCSILTLIALLMGLSRQTVDRVVVSMWCGWMVKLSGAKPEGFLFLFLHCSHMDIPILFVSSPKSFRFGAKASLFKIPIFGKAISMAGTLPITRDDRRKVMEVYRQAEERVENGEAFALAPEGGRRLGHEIPAFKSGPFIFAINAKMPVVPVVVCGVHRILPKDGFLINPKRWSTPVGVKFLPPVDMAKVPLEDMKTVKNQIRTDMVREYNEMLPRYKD